LAEGCWIGYNRCSFTYKWEGVVNIEGTMKEGDDKPPVRQGTAAWKGGTRSTIKNRGEKGLRKKQRI